MSWHNVSAPSCLSGRSGITQSRLSHLTLLFFYFFFYFIVFSFCQSEHGGPFVAFVFYKSAVKCFTYHFQPWTQTLCALSWFLAANGGISQRINTMYTAYLHIKTGTFATLHEASSSITMTTVRVLEWKQERGRNWNCEGDEADGAGFIDDCFNIRRRQANFIGGWFPSALGFPLRYSKMTLAAHSWIFERAHRARGAISEGVEAWEGPRPG